MDHPQEAIESGATPEPSSRAPKIRSKARPKQNLPPEPVPEPPKRLIKKEPVPPEVPHPHSAEKKFCEHCGSKQKKPRKQSAPTEKQVESRKQFSEKVAEAKKLQSQEPGLTYKDAIKRVYVKP